VDRAGNSATQPKTITYNKSAILLTINSPVTANGDNVVNGAEQTAISVSGTSVAGATVSVTIRDQAGTEVGPYDATADASGVWSITGAQAFDVSGLSDGTLFIEAETLDTLGNKATASRYLLKDTFAAVPVLNTPITADNVINNAEALAGYTFSGRGEPGATITITVADAGTGSFTPATTITVGSDGVWNAPITLSSIVDGTATITVRQTDSEGNVSLDRTATFTVDRTAPAINIANPVDGALVGSAGVGSLTVDGTTVAGGQVKIVISDGTLTTTREVTATGTGAWTADFDISGLADGALTITASTSDAAGNPNSDQHSVTKDTVAPTLTIDNALSANGDNIINNAESGTFAVEGTGVDGLTVSVTISDASSSVTGSAVVSGSRWSVVTNPSVATLTPGPLTIVATETDPAGNTATVTKTVTLDLSTSVTINVVSGDDIITETEARYLQVTGTGEPGSVVTLTADDSGDASTAAVTRTAEVTTTGTWSITLDVHSLNDGQITLSAASVDIAGNTASAVRPVMYSSSDISLSINTPVTASGDNVVSGWKRAP